VENQVFGFHIHVHQFAGFVVGRGPSASENCVRVRERKSFLYLLIKGVHKFSKI
jgi:hypothetical protein